MHSARFSGEPLTRWSGQREMILQADFYFIDDEKKQWLAPKGSRHNGATIPRALWSAVGAPFSGPYRKSSIVHDVAVGEFSDNKPTAAERKAADRMFYQACLCEGCDEALATTLYIGVRLGSYGAMLNFRRHRSRGRDIRATSNNALNQPNQWEAVTIDTPWSPETLRQQSEDDKHFSEEVYQIMDTHNSNDDLDQLDQLIDTFIGEQHEPNNPPR